MKPVNYFLQLVFPLPWLVNLALLTPFVICLLGSVLHYCKIRPARNSLMNSLQELKNQGMQFIVHADRYVFKLKNIKVQEYQISGDKEALNSQYLEYLDPNQDDQGILTRVKEDMGQKEIHLYTDQASANTNRIVLTDNQIRAIHIYEPGNKVADNRAMKISGTVVSVLAVLGAIIVACSLAWNAIRVI